MKRTRRKVATINSGTLADVAFLLLIFFMVATTMHRQKSISMKLPPLVDAPPQKVNEDLVLTLMINGKNEVMLEDNQIHANIDEAITTHLNTMISKKIKPTINLQMHPQSNYESYLSLLSSIKSAIRVTKENQSKKIYQRKLEELSRDEYVQLSKTCGIKITEREILL